MLPELLVAAFFVCLFVLRGRQRAGGRAEGEGERVLGRLHAQCGTQCGAS